MIRVGASASLVLVLVTTATFGVARADAVARGDAVTPADWARYTGASPSPRVDASIAYDSARGRTVLFGGFTSQQSGTPLADTWEWDGAGWTQILPTSAPRARGGSGVAFDAERNRVVLFGGSSGHKSLSDTWEYDGTTWTQMAAPISPSARALPGMAYHAASRRVVLFGGAASLGDTWEWDGAAWVQRQPLTSPPGRAWAPLAYDSVRQRVVLFGGAHCCDYFARLADTWEWDGTNWSRRQPVISPSPRFGHTVAYDTRRAVTVLFGGETRPALSDETWEWDGTAWTLHWTTAWPPERVSAAAAFDGSRGQTVLFGGWSIACNIRTSNFTYCGAYVTLDDTWLYGAPAP